MFSFLRKESTESTKLYSLMLVLSDKGFLSSEETTSIKSVDQLIKSLSSKGLLSKSELATKNQIITRVMATIVKLGKKGKLDNDTISVLEKLYGSDLPDLFGFLRSSRLAN